MPAPLAKGLIILSSLLIAAGAAVYQDPVVKRWIDAQRRRIAMALHSLGDEIDLARNASLSDSPTSAPSEQDEEQRRRRRREDLVRRNRNELIRKARDEGVAVDLDELAAIGGETEEEAATRLRQAREAAERRDKNRSFDTLVEADGTLRAETTASDAQSGNSAGLRHRHTASQGFATGHAWANPFVDEGMLFEHEQESRNVNTATADADRIELPFLPEGSMSHEDYEMQLRLLDEAKRSKTSTPVPDQAQFDELYDATPSKSMNYVQELAVLEETQKQILLRAQERHARGDGGADVTLADLEGLPPSQALEELRKELIAAGLDRSAARGSRESTATLPGPARSELIDVSEVKSATPEMTSKPSAPSLTASYHSAVSPQHVRSPSVDSFVADAGDADAPTPTGTLTPVEVDFDGGFDTAASHVGTNASDIGDVDLLSDFGVESVRSGMMTPSSFGGSEWTDMDSEVGVGEDEHHPHLPQQYETAAP